MKKIVTLLLVLMMMLSLAACGDKPNTESSSESSASVSNSTQEQQVSNANNSDNSKVNLSDEQIGPWLKTKTGKFYSQFTDGIYMEYEMTFEGQIITVISATSGDKTYSETKMDNQSAGVTVLDGETMYSIDHASKTVVKMSLQTSGQEMLNTMIQEEDVDPAALVHGTREIDGKTYDTEEWNMDGAKSILCFDGDKLVYMVAEYEGEETIIKIIKTDSKVDKNLFEIPADYQVISY